MTGHLGCPLSDVVVVVVEQQFIPSQLLKHADGTLTYRADATAAAMLDRLRGATSLR
ncbi:hypothetical protein ACTWPT_34515 [Nonomuraea sp. 3N208]|uniref:hypothetical protein n=1 Tax=Nonomuraea sp. 3N208 TaxID=3457421 RepID=UPI003FD0BB80